MNKKILLTTLGLSVAALVGCGGTSEAKKAGHFIAGNIATMGDKGAVDYNFVAALLDRDGKIVKLRLDTAQFRVDVNEANDGLKVTSKKLIGTNGDFKSKWELLNDYGMGSAEQGEWYVQAENFENWVVGKTISEVKGQLKEDNNLKDGSTIGVTIHANEWVNALEKAALTKVAVEDVENLSIGVGAVNSLTSNGEKKTGQGYYTIGQAAFSADKKVAAARVDSYQPDYTFTKATPADGETPAAPGVVSFSSKGQNDVANKQIKSKHDLKEAYGMVQYSDATLEWYEQANKLAEHLKGKTLTEGFANKDSITGVGVTIVVDVYKTALMEAETTAFNSRK